jgi:large subunit ribosomal protein L4
MADNSSLRAAAFTAQGTSRDAVALPETLFDGTVNVPVMHQAVKAYLANQRQGTAATKIRKYVTGGNQKPWKQKGTGRARQGSIRATQWKGGGKPFGPTPRKYDKKMPAEMRRAALRDAIAARIAAGGLSVVDQLGVNEPRTKVLTTRLRELGVEAGPTLLVVSERTHALDLAARNVPWLEVETPRHASVYQVLRNGRVVFERAALLALEEALKS